MPYSSGVSSHFVWAVNSAKLVLNAMKDSVYWFRDAVNDGNYEARDDDMG